MFLTNLYIERIYAICKLVRRGWWICQQTWHRGRASFIFKLRGRSCRRTDCIYTQLRANPMTFRSQYVLRALTCVSPCPHRISKHRSHFKVRCKCGLKQQQALTCCFHHIPVYYCECYSRKGAGSGQNRFWSRLARLREGKLQNKAASALLLPCRL